MKRILKAVLLAAGIVTAMLAMSGCGPTKNDDPKTATYTSQEDAIKGATKETQNVVAQIEAREGKVVVVWENTEAEVPFTLGLVEKDGENWKVTDTRGATMKDKFEGSGVYPVNDGLITYAISPSIDDPVAQNFGEHKETENWCFHWTVVPELPQ